MKFPPRMRRIVRRMLGVGRAPALDADGLAALEMEGPVLVLALGERRLDEIARTVPKDHAIVLHCG